MATPADLVEASLSAGSAIAGITFLGGFVAFVVVAFRWVRSVTRSL